MAAGPTTPPATVFSGAGTANATTALNAFRAAIGGVNNGGTPSPQVGGRREINWDGVALDGTDFGGNSHVIIPNKTVGIPVNRFQSRGVRFAEEYAVTGDGFVSANPGVAGQFPAFSDGKTFAMFNDNGIELNFVLPSDPNTAPVQAGVRGFGVIFIDVEKPNTTSIEYFNGSISLGKFFVEPGPSAQAEFLGVLFDNPIITNVEITVGEAQIFSVNGNTVIPGPKDITLDPINGKDLADTDDFVLSEPVPCDMTPQLLTLQDIGPDTEPLGVNPVEHQVLAIVTDGCGERLPNVVVDFAVTGPNATAGSAVTGPNGEALLTFFGRLPGTDELTAQAEGGANPTAGPISHTFLLPLKPPPGTRILAQGTGAARRRGSLSTFSVTGAFQRGLTGGDVFYNDGPTSAQLRTQRVLSVIAEGNQATIIGRGFLRFGRRTRPVIFRVDLVDGGPGGRNDRFGLLLDPSAFIPIDFNAPLERGNVSILNVHP
jgi:hypothetical protein